MYLMFMKSKIKKAQKTCLYFFAKTINLFIFSVFWGLGPAPMGPWPHVTKCKNYWDFDVNYQILLFKNEYPLPFGWESSIKSS